MLCGRAPLVPRTRSNMGKENSNSVARKDLLMGEGEN
jgi:hypothetical protein